MGGNKLIEAVYLTLTKQLDKGLITFKQDINAFKAAGEKEQTAWKTQKTGNGALKKAVSRLADRTLSGRYAARRGRAGQAGG